MISEGKDQKDEESASDKRRRGRVTHHQKTVLEKTFQTNQYPDQIIRQNLATQLGMEQRQVQVWFQNRRTKSKISSLKTTQDLLQMVTAESNLNLQNSDGNTLLIKAASCGSPFVKKLLDKGAACDIINNKGQTALWVSVRNGHETIVDMLLEKKNGYHVNIPEKEHGQTPLHIAALNGFESLTLLLLSKGEADVNKPDKYGNTPLHHACIQGYPAIVKQMISCSADVDVTSHEGYTPLHAAALIGNVDIIEMLIRAKASLEIKDHLGYSALNYAIREQHSNAINGLLEHGASTSSVTDDWFSPVHIACCRPSLDILKMIFASIEGSSTTAYTIKSLSAVRMTTKRGWNGLHLAAMNGNTNIVQFIVESQFIENDKLITDKDGKTGWQLAQERGHLHLRSWLAPS